MHTIEIVKPQMEEIAVILLCTYDSIDCVTFFVVFSEFLFLVVGVDISTYDIVSGEPSNGCAKTMQKPCLFAQPNVNQPVFFPVFFLIASLRTEKKLYRR